MPALRSLDGIQNWAAFLLEAFSCFLLGEVGVGRGEAGKVLRGCCRGVVKGQVAWGQVVVRGRQSWGGNSWKNHSTDGVYLGLVTFWV